MNAPNTLGLDDDWDSVELLIEIERVFEVNFSAQDASTVYTMGDLHDLVTSKLEGAGGEKCRTSVSFYRVRRALKAVLGNVDIRTDTLLSSIWDKSPKQLFAQVQSHCDLRLASLSSTEISERAGLLIVAVISGAPILWVAKVNGWLILALAGALLAVGLAFTRLDPLAFGPTMQTVGDLARRTASLNYGALVGLGGRTDVQGIWEVLVEVAGGFSETLPPEKIERTTVILQSQFKKASARA